MDNNIYYVYLHKKQNGDIFYVGKGKGNRAYKNNRRSDLWNYTRDKHGLIIEIYRDNLSEKDALALEMELIKKLGRVDLGTGNLVNFTDGGDTTNLSSISRKKISDKQKERFSKPEERAKLVAMLTGRESPKKINYYIIIGKASGEVLEGYLSDIVCILGDKFRERLLGLIAGRSESTGGWVLNPTKEKFISLANRKKNPTIFEFVSSQFSFIGTKSEFNCIIGINPSPLFVNQGNKRVVKGWGVIREGESLEYVLSLVNKDYTPKYIFYNENLNKTFTGTSREFSSELGIKFSSISGLFRKNRSRKVHGWEIKEKL